MYFLPLLQVVAVMVGSAGLTLAGVDTFITPLPGDGPHPGVLVAVFIGTLLTAYFLLTDKP